MKAILVALLLVTAFSWKLNVSSNSRIDDLNRFFTLSTIPAQSDVTYSFAGLPDGFAVQNSQLTYSGAIAIRGQYPVKITATDLSGQSESTIVLLDINLSGDGKISYTNTAGLNLANSLLTNANGASSGASSNGATTSTTTSTSTSSSSTGSSSSSSTGSTASGATGSTSANGQVLTINGVDYNFGNAFNINVGGNSGASGASGATSTPSISDLVTQYSTTTTTTNTVSTPISSYPSPNIPTGPLPNQVPNSNIINIATAQAPLSSQPLRASSEYDVNITNLFYQQTQIGQTIANLLEIIRQGTANRNKAQEDINTYTEQLNSNTQAQQNLSITISNQENKVKGIQSAIDGATAQLNGFSTDLNTVTGQINAAKSTGLGFTQQLSIALNNQDGIKDQITNANAIVDGIKKGLNDQAQTCNQANSIINTLRGNITALQGSILGIDGKVSSIDGQINDYNTQIAALQKQINDLLDKVRLAKEDKQNLINLNYTVPQQIANLNAQIETQKAACASNAGYTQADLTAALDKLAALQGRLTGSNNDIVSINSQINVTKAQLTDLLAKLGQINANIAKTQANINALKGSLPAEQSSLSQLYVQGNKYVQTVSNSNSSLQAALTRFKRESDALTIANINLQQARVEQQNIGQKINLILQQNTAGLPFPAAPESSGLLATLTSSNSIDSIGAYLLRAYGAGLGLDVSGYNGLRALYTFGSGSRLRSNCPELILASSAAAAVDAATAPAASGKYAGKGKILKVDANNVVEVETAQGTQTIALNDCSIRLANIPNYNLSVGDVLVWKGAYDTTKKTWTADQITCLK
jgi:predicted  nucleic acid-binding Zn-ribbon protein